MVLMQSSQRKDAQTTERMSTNHLLELNMQAGAFLEDVYARCSIQSHYFTGQGILDTEFGEDKITSRSCRFPWSLRSPYLTPSDFCLWRYLNSRMYQSGPPNLLQLKYAIDREVLCIHPDLLHATHYYCCICELLAMHYSL